MRVITRFDRASDEYVVEVEWPDRDKSVERFADYDAFNSRVQGLHIELIESSWMQQGAPGLLKDGWRGPTSRS